MRHPFKLSALLALLLLAVSLAGATGAAAQADDEFSPADLDGVEYAYARTWEVAESATSAAAGSTPEATSPETGESSSLVLVGAMVIQFEDDATAEAGYDALATSWVTPDLLTTPDGVEPSEWELLAGDQSTSYYVLYSESGAEVGISVSLVQQDNFVFIVMASSAESGVQVISTTLVETMIDNEGEGEGEFNEDGTSTGGLWDKLPAADDEMFQGLPATDEILFPEAEA